MRPIILGYPYNFPIGHILERHSPEGHNPECTQSPMDTIPNGHNFDWTTITNEHESEWTPSRMDTILNRHYLEWTGSRMGTIPNGQRPERTQSRMVIMNGTIPNGHNAESTRSRMHSLQNGHLHLYVVTSVLHTYAWKGPFAKTLSMKMAEYIIADFAELCYKTIS